MTARRLLLILLVCWVQCVVLSFVQPYFTAPTGDGFVRGMNRITIWILWQLAALILAVAMMVIRALRARELSPAMQWVGQGPLILSVIGLGGLFGYLYYAV